MCRPNSRAGHNFGILGANGSGKSTLIRLLAGSELPDRGTIRRRVRVSFPLGFGGTVHGALSGRENVAFIARVYGAGMRQTARFVEEFAELGEYFDMPVDTYSAGMRARLAFGVCLAIDFDVYLIDEVTEIGDERFRRKCAAAFRERLRRPTSSWRRTIITRSGSTATAGRPRRWPAAIVRQRRGRVRMLPEHADGAGLMPAAGERTRTAAGLASAGFRRAGNPIAVATATAVPARPTRRRLRCPRVRKPGTRRREAGAAPHAAGFRAWLSPRLLSFIAVVVVPTVLAAVYLFAAASDQYVAEFRFALSSAEAPRFDPASLLAGIAAPAPPAALESQILVQYIGSRAIVDRIDATLDLRRLFSPPQADWWSRLSPPATIETLVRYWKGQVDPVYDAANGTVTVRVRAFDPGEALRAGGGGRRGLRGSGQRAVDAVAKRRAGSRECGAGPGRRPAQDGSRPDPRLPRSRGADRSGADRGSERRAGGPAARRVEQGERRTCDAEALHARRRALGPGADGAYPGDRDAAALAGRRDDRSRGGAPGPADAPSRGLRADRERAALRRGVVSARAARPSSRRMPMPTGSACSSPVSFRPSLPEEPLYPRRWRTLGTVALIAFALWGIGGLAVQSVREHLA